MMEPGRLAARIVCDSCGFSRGPAGQASLWMGPVRVAAARRCAACGRAIRRSYRMRAQPPERHSIRLHCTGCGALSEAPLTWSPLPAGEEFDGMSGLPLWLAIPCRGHTLWALNGAHLSWLRDHVGASLRERAPGLNASLASRLPTWLKRAGNRAEVLRCLDRLTATLG